ncbi:LacI family transcriptional regulator [Sesbania bispinosa]|nr:LacI family transcriptional regulator [Sesbania bispinosa]
MSPPPDVIAAEDGHPPPNAITGEEANFSGNPLRLDRPGRGGIPSAWTGAFTLVAMASSSEGCVPLDSPTLGPMLTMRGPVNLAR